MGSLGLELSAQYDSIGAKYNTVKEYPTQIIETSNLHAAIASHVSGARVLDLACGTGYYSRKLVEEWGAASVVAVDQSPAMIDIARELTNNDKIEFLVGDATTLGKIDDEGFDLVIAAWLLNYAGTEDEQAAMYETIFVNLKSDKGIFVGITPPPHPSVDMDGIDQFVHSLFTGPPRPLSMAARYYARNERMGPDCRDAGWRVEVKAYDNKGETILKMRNYHMASEVYERAARKGGMKGRFEWKKPEMKENVREQAIRANGEEYWKAYWTSFGPHFGLLVVQKGAE